MMEVSLPAHMGRTAIAIEAVIEQRLDQHGRFGFSRHTWPEWMTLITEEVGEAAQAANDLYWHGRPLDPGLHELKIELAQAAALILQTIEHINQMQLESVTDADLAELQATAPAAGGEG